MSITRFDVEFNRDGTALNFSQVEAALDAVATSTDVLIMSHGWNNNKEEAAELYDGIINSMEKVLRISKMNELSTRNFNAVQVYWPSKRFEDSDLIPGGGAAAVGGSEDPSVLIRILDELKIDPYVLGDETADPKRNVIVERAKNFIQELHTDEGKIKFVSELRSLIDESSAHPDDGSSAFFTEDPVEMFARLNDTVIAPLGRAASSGGVGFDGAAGAVGLQDMFNGAISAARRLANYTTYCAMKQRAGQIGRTGVADLAKQLRQKNTLVRLHFIGHSFGGRLVTAASSSLPENSRCITLTLLQAAFSHNGFAPALDEIPAGAFRSIIEDRRVSGPIIITHTKNDLAVGIAYPLASRITRDQAASLGDENDPYGGMGRNGAQRTNARSQDLLSVGRQYDFESDNIYNLRADEFIKNHGDVCGNEVAYAILNAIRSS